MDEQTPEGPIGTPPWEVPPAGPPPAGPPPAAPLPPGAPGASGPIVNWAPAPAATAVEVPGAPGLSFADTASRIVAYVIDILILGIIGFVIAVLLGLGETTTRTNGSTTLSSYFVSTSNPIVSLIYAVI